MGIDQLLADARARITRLTPEQAARAVADGAVMVDTRTFEQRRDHGVVPGAVVVGRNVLEWRVDPASPYVDPVVAARRGPLIVMCQEGYSSSLAAATLKELGIADAADLEGGFEAWAAAGLPVELP
ncbi:MAG: rhodanese-like domain-containing protein [Gaiellales bacterium]